MRPSARSARRALRAGRPASANSLRFAAAETGALGSLVARVAAPAPSVKRKQQRSDGGRRARETNLAVADLEVKVIADAREGLEKVVPDPRLLA